MRDIEEFISPLVESQFPALYQEEGPLFVLFAKEYFKWMEESGNTLNISRKLFDYRDIDSTIDDYLIHFKEKYLKGVEFSSFTSKRRLIKSALDIFRSKGTERSIDLLFKLAFGVNIQIYNPGDDVLRASDGTWVVPRYLEVTRSYKTPLMVGKQITGSFSNATAFVEYVITRNINGKLIDVVFLSDLVGDFVVNDIITTDGIVKDSPKVTGSLTSVDITLAGSGFTPGEEVYLSSAKGIEGKARVSSVFSATGLVTFQIISGGWGYSTSAYTDVSTKVITLTDVTNANASITDFTRYETFKEDLFQLQITNNTGDHSPNLILTNNNGDTAVVVRATQDSLTANSANLVVNPISGNIFSVGNTVFLANQSYIATGTTITFSPGSIIRQRTGSSNTAIGTVIDRSNVAVLTINSTPSISSNGLHVGTYIEQPSSNAHGYIKAIPRENNFGFTNVNSIVVSNTTGTFDNTGMIFAYSDNSKSLYLANATPNNATSGYLYLLDSTSGSARWSTGNTALLSALPTTNASILVASDIGGYYTSNTDVSATGKVIGSNSTAVGLLTITNTFYSAQGTIGYGLLSNTYANIVSVSTGFGADFSVGAIENSETVRISPDLLSSNNDGPGACSVPFSSMLISGANSGYGTLSSVFVYNGGTGYTNGNLVTFTGGFTGYGAANATVSTNSSGGISSITIAANVGSGYVSTPSYSIVNSSGGSTGVGTGAQLEPGFAYGFVKMPYGDLNDYLLELFTFQNLTIGTITSLSNINPGEDYNIKPFVNVYEPLIAAYGKRDFILTFTGLTGPSVTFAVGELVSQTINTASLQVTSNNYTGNTSGNYEVSENVTVYNGSGSAVGTGTVLSSSNASGTYTVIITANTGTYTNGYFMVGDVTKSNTTIRNTSAYTSSAYARGRVTSVSNNVVYLSRQSMFTEFTVGGVITGGTSGMSATVTDVAENLITNVMGDNANITSNVISSSGSISALKLVDSGIGFEQDEGVDIVSTDGLRSATGKANIIKHGVGEGYYSSTRGFLDNNKYIHDGNYYQDYSYEVQSALPFDKYSDLLKQLLHVSGTKLFGKVVISTVANSNITSTSSVEISS